MSLDVAPTTLRRSWIVAGLLSLVGIGLAVELTIVHARVHANPATRSFCTFSEHISCDKTAQSVYALFAGVPLSLWGLLAYTVLLALSVWGWQSRKLFVLVPFAFISAFCALAAIVLLSLTLVLRNLCIFCLASWIIDWSLFLVTWKMVQKVGLSRLLDEARQLWNVRRLWLIAAGAGALCAFVGMRLITPKAWAKASSENSHLGARISNKERAASEAKLPQGLDEAGHPYIGSNTPKLTVVEFADYQCPHCAIAHDEMRELLAKNPNDIRIIHRHFPLDNQCNSLVQRPFHIHACDYARLAACASLVGKFWQANDFLFERGRDQAPVTAETLAKQLNIDATQLQDCVGKAGTEIVRADVDEGLRNNVQGTPSFIVDGKVYPGHLPDDMLEPYEK